MPVQTGYDSVVAHRVDDIFASAAEYDGVVTEVSDTHITVEYSTPNTKPLTVELGRRYGISAGSTIPHDLVTDLKVGDKVKKDDVISWNRGFFVRDRLNHKQVLWKSGVLTRVALLESPGTFEDSCETSAALNEKMMMPQSEPRLLEITADQTVSNLVKVGDNVEADSILCNIEDPVTSDGELFQDDSLDTLRLLARNSPRAKVDGVVNRIEVEYHVDLDDDEAVSESVRKLIVAADKERAARVKRLKNGEALTGLAVEDLEYGVVNIRLYIDSSLPAGDGDKFVFGNQMKSVARREIYGDITTEKDGLPVDAIFPWTSVDNRQVLSFQLMGTTIPLMELANLRAVKAYES